MVPMVRIEGPLFEYACHEGNDALTNILAGARAKEKEKEKAAESTQPSSEIASAARGWLPTTGPASGVETHPSR
jgi:hypothetical protein